MAAPKTVITYRLNGSDRDFEIPFEYLARKFVVVTLIGVDRKVLTLSTDYRFTQRTIITTTQGWGPSDGYTLIEIKRLTSATERLVDFSDGSVLRAYDLNISNVQSLHIAEEGRDIATDTIGVDNNGNLDARGRRIVNLAEAVDPGDAVTLKQNQEWAGSALNQANRAEQQANISAQQAQLSTQRASSALASQNASSVSEANAKTSETNTKTSETNTKTSEIRALASQQSAAASNNSAISQAGVATSEANRSRTEADRAKTEADKLGNSNLFMGTLRQVVSPFVSWRDGWGLDAQTIATNIITPRVAGNIKVESDLVAANNTMQARNVDATNQLTEAGSRAWTAATFDPASKISRDGLGVLNAPILRTKGLNGPYGGALEIQSVAGSVAEGEGPAITMHWANKFAAKLYMAADGSLRWGVPGGSNFVIAGRRMSGGNVSSGWKVDEDGWMECWGTTPAINSGATQAYSFPKEFVGGTPQIFVQSIGARGSQGEANTSITNISSTAFSMHSGNAATLSFFWRAFGRAF